MVFQSYALFPHLNVEQNILFGLNVRRVDKTEQTARLRHVADRNRDRAITGEATSEFLRKFRAEYGIFGVGAIDHEGQMLDYDYRDVHISLTAMEISRKKLVVADSSKFHGDAMMQLAHVSEVDALFTDATPPKDIVHQLTAHDVGLFIAD